MDEDDDDLLPGRDDKDAVALATLIYEILREQSPRDMVDGEPVEDDHTILDGTWDLVKVAKALRERQGAGGARQEEGGRAPVA